MLYSEHRQLNVMNEMASLALSKVMVKKKATDLMQKKLGRLREKQLEQKRELRDKDFNKNDSPQDSLFDSDEDKDKANDKSPSYSSLEIETDSDDDSNQSYLSK